MTPRGLRLQSAFFEELFEAAPGAIALLTPGGAVLRVNQAFEDLFGYDRAEAVGSNIDDLIVPAELRAVSRRLTRVVGRGEGDVERETVRMRKDGARVDVSLRGQPIRFEGRQLGTYVTYFDITQKKQEKKELREAKEAAEAASVAKSMFLANTSHEIRTPLNAIIGTADLLSESDLEEDQRQFVDILRSAGQTLLDLVNSVLDLSKIEAAAFELDVHPFRLIELIEDVIEVLAVDAHQKGLELIGRVGQNVPTAVVGDETRLRQVLLNLLGNAVKFTESGEVGLSVEQLVPTRAEAGSAPQILFEVWDTGSGISEEARERIFDRFTQADPSTTRKHGGTGLGLTICRSLVELMGGELSLESEVGAGSRFAFRLALPVADEVPEARPEITRVDLSGMQTLVVDDNETNRLILREILSAWGAEVVEADSGSTALGLLRAASADGAPFDLVLLDGHMPGMDGFEVAESIYGDDGIDVATVLMITSLDRPGDIARSRELAVDSYMVKPVQRGPLARRLHTVLQRKRATATTTQAPEPEPPPSSPAAEPAGVPPAAEPAAVPPAADSEVRILVAEDVEDNRLLVQLYLKHTDFRFTMVEDGEQAVAAFREQGPFDIVLMDIQMPNMDGYEATRAIRAIEADEGRGPTPIVALTAHALQEQRVLSRQAGCDEHIIKPIRKQELIDVIRRHAMGDANE